MPAGMVALVGLMILLPLMYMEVIVVALSRLGISPIAGLFIVFCLFAGSIVNIPIKRLHAHDSVNDITWALYGLDRWLPIPSRPERVIAINVGGCLVPLLLALYQLVRLHTQGALLPAAAAVAMSVMVCFNISRFEPGRGVVIPVLLPGMSAALFALVLYPTNAPAVAFCAGVLGPLIGADILRLRQISTHTTGVASIGGAGTFDGIVISGVIALLLS